MIIGRSEELKKLKAMMAAVAAGLALAAPAVELVRDDAKGVWTVANAHYKVTLEAKRGYRIAALAYGTESIPKVDKIVGPGNAFVAEAKKQVFGRVSIDMIAGPSEILIVADSKTNPKYAAADLLSQAEHDKLASAVLVTDSDELARQVSEELERQIHNHRSAVPFEPHPESQDGVRSPQGNGRVESAGRSQRRDCNP